MNEDLFQNIVDQSNVFHITLCRCEFIMSDCAEGSERWKYLEQQISSCYDDFVAPNVKFGTWTEMYEALRGCGTLLPPTPSRLLRNRKGPRNRIEFASVPMAKVCTRAASADVANINPHPMIELEEEISA